MVSTWSWIGRRREVHILGKELEHLKAVRETAAEALRVIESLKGGKPGEAAEYYMRVFHSERKADEVKSGILEELGTGLIHPIDREEIVRLVLSADDIAAHVKAGCRRLIIASRLESNLPEFILDAFHKLVSITLEAIDRLVESIGLLRKNPRDAIRIASQVEELEERADDVRMEAEEELLRWCNENKPGACLSLYRTLESLETSSDKCEDVADIIRSIAVLSA